MGKFGWSMPAGAWESTLPGEEPESPIFIACPNCGVPLRLYPKFDPDHVEWFENRIINDEPAEGPVGEEIVVVAGAILWYLCRVCGHWTSRPTEVFC